MPPNVLRVLRFASVLIAHVAISTPVFAQIGQSFEQVRAAAASSETLVLDRHGEVIHRLRTDPAVRKGQWVALADMSAALRTAMVASEDQRFYQHSGVDWRAVPAAAWANLWNQRTRGASTLTMQLAGLLDADLRQRPGGRSVGAKLGQAAAATWLETRWRKDQILEAYLNLVPYRGELVGIDALSRTLFAKAPHGLDEAESAIAAALVRAPNAAPAQVATRACGVLKRLHAPAAAPPDCTALALLTEAALARRAFDASAGIAPHLARRLAAAHRGAPGTRPRTIGSTLDGALQRMASQTLQQHIRELQGRNVHDGALLVLDNASGQVLAWVGSTGSSLSQAAEVDGVTALRQPGSTLKPFLYAQALAEKRLTAATLLDDSPAHLQTAAGLYIPQNYDRQFKGWVSVRTALAASLNVPAVRTLVMVSPEAFAQQLKRLGIALPETGDYYGYSLALGSAEVSLLALTNAYRALARSGRASPVVWQTAPEAAAAPRASAGASTSSSTSTNALDPRAAFIVGDILSDPNARSRTFGTSNVLTTRFWSAVKTGTSKDMRDNWAVGYSQRYTVGVWVGNAAGEAMWNVSGTSGAAPVWAAVMAWLHQKTPSRAPAPPPGVQAVAVRFGDALEAPRTEWFIAGTSQPLFASPQDATDSIVGGAVSTPKYPKKALKSESPVPTTSEAMPGSAAPAPHITAPVNGTIFALDPDIPPDRQRVTFTTSATGHDAQTLRWFINDRPFGRGAQAQWLPWPGRHRATLQDGRGQTLDAIHFEVRGAGVAAPPPRRGTRPG